jgi:hypothetical protein
MRFLSGFALALTMILATQSASSAQSAAMLETVSNRADLVSGGDVLVRVRPTTRRAATSPGMLSLNGAPLADVLHAAPDGDGFLGLVTGLNLGDNDLTFVSGGNTAALQVTNYPIGGPIFSGPHLQPWACTTQANGLGAAVDADCNAPPTFAFFYRKVGATPAEFAAYDPASPPPAGDIATTTTDRGQTVPYIVRVETGAINRSIYKITVPFDPAQTWSPWTPQAAWNGKLVWLFGAGAGIQYTQGTLANGFDDNSLSRGFATAAAVMTTEGTNANIKLNAEALMMIKEHFAETYGPIRYTIGSGCSGGAIQQHSIGDQYPGLVDGFLPVCSYPDLWSLAVNGHDCQLLSPYFTATSPGLWSNAPQRQAVLGLNSEQECPGQDGPAAFGLRWFVSTNPGCQLPAAARYNPFVRPDGVRCTLRGYHVNELGTRPDGNTYQVFDNVGVQYGLKALQSGSISPEQFVDLNEKVGGLDADGNFQTQRTVADTVGLERMYQSGLITYGQELGKYPIIDARTNDNHEMHNNSEWMFTRNRLLRSNGNAANEIHWWEESTDPNPVGNVSRPNAGWAIKSFDLMDRWLADIEADASASPHEAKVVAHRPDEAHDLCMIDGREFAWTPDSICDQRFTYTGMARMAAGGPNTNDVLKCQLKPLSRTEYSVTFTDAQWARLQQTFADGVCDYARPGEGQQPPIAPWLSFAGGPGGTPIGPPPVALVR